jgi:polar amino acid transport system substrate-binding protein
MKKLIPLAAATALLLTACGNANYTTTQIPAKPSPSAAAPPAAAAPKPCADGKDLTSR